MLRFPTESAIERGHYCCHRANRLIHVEWHALFVATLVAQTNTVFRQLIFILCPKRGHTEAQSGSICSAKAIPVKR